MAPPSRNARLAAMLTVALLVASVAAFVRGWLHSEMFAKIAWYADGGTRAALLSGAYWLIGLAVVASGRRALAGKFAAIAAIAIAACVGVLPLLATGGRCGLSCSGVTVSPMLAPLDGNERSE